jgi:hypothetical protein
MPSFQLIMKQYSIDEAHALIEKLHTLAGLFESPYIFDILRLIANEPGYAANDMVRAYTREFLRTGMGQ